MKNIILILAVLLFADFGVLADKITKEHSHPVAGEKPEEKVAVQAPAVEKDDDLDDEDIVPKPAKENPFCRPKTTGQIIGEKIALYFPNRFLDLFDIMSFDIGVGLTIKFEFRCTRLCDFGFGRGMTGMMIKDYNRQCGFGWQEYADSSFMFIAGERYDMGPACGTVQKYIYECAGVPNPQDEVYNICTGPRDFWETGMELGVGIIELRFAFHPIDVADFCTGLVFFDLKGDDITFDSFQ